MTPPEVILDRWVKMQARARPQCRGYVGKLDVDKVKSPSLRSFLRFIQGAMNQALQSENANGSGGTEHPPFHFDYLDVSDGTKNAHAFQHEGFSFIATTLPLVEMLWDISQRLGLSHRVFGLLGIDRELVRPEALQALLFQFQLAFLVSHEYTHHVHRHCGGDYKTAVWDEFIQDATREGLRYQAQELDADGYGLYLTLANYVRGPARRNALGQIGMQNLTDLKGDEFLLTAFFVALTALFCSLWPENVPITAILRLPHPPAPVRIDYAIRIAVMWSGQNSSIPQSWFEAERFQAIYLAATDALPARARPQWDAHIAFLRSNEGAAYDRSLFQNFEAVRGAAEQAVRSDRLTLASPATR
jgi:hypothetical protein